MRIEEFNAWEFDKELTERCLIKCPKCNDCFCHTDWKETEVECEDCGSHAAIRCPGCEEFFDHVYSKKFEVRN